MKTIIVALVLAASAALPAAAESAAPWHGPAIIPIQAVDPKPAQPPEPEVPPSGGPEQDDQPSPRTLALAKVALASVLVGKCQAVEFQDEPLTTYFLENIGELDSDTSDILSGLAFAAATVLGDKSVAEICDEAVAKFGPDGSEAKGLVARK
jgi:hypothetical protein